MLSFDQLQIAVAAAKRRFDLIRKKYPESESLLGHVIAKRTDRD